MRPGGFLGEYHVAGDSTAHRQIPKGFQESLGGLCSCKPVKGAFICNLPCDD